MQKKHLLSLFFLLLVAAMAQAIEFQTQWNIPANTTSITFNALTTGAVHYDLGTIASGSFTKTSAGPVTITFAPSSLNRSTILFIEPQNLRRFYMGSGTDVTKLTTVWAIGDVPWLSMAHMFDGCSNMEYLAGTAPNLSSVADMSYMFYGCSSMVGNASFNTWNTANVTNMSYMFYGATLFNQPIGNWNTVNVTNMESMFDNATSFNQPIGNWNTANVINMVGMFDHASTFNQPIGNWNTVGVIDMSFMFYSATSFNQPIGNWNTANVTNMQYMFQNATSFNQSIGNWNTSNIANMYRMFSGATSFNQPIGNWNTANVTSMHQMFSGATSFNKPIDNWNTASVMDMGYMFSNATSFNQPIDNWTLNPGVDMTDMLKNSGMDCANYSTTLIGWKNNNPTVSGRSLGATGRMYGTNAVNARNILTTTQVWTITGDSPSGTFCGTCTLSATASVINHTTCGQNNGSATANPSGSSDYGYVWSNGATTQTITNLAAGSYTVTVTDWLGCTVTASVNINASTPVSTTVTPTHTTCGLSNGSATANPSGGSGYTYLWSSGATSATISGLAPGSYTVTVTDWLGCTVTASVTINSSTGITTTVTAYATTCGLSNGSATANPSGGSGYTYLWSNGATSATISGLAPGSYTVTVTSSNSCTITASTTINSSTGITTTVTPTHTTCGQSNGAASVIATGGITYTYLWSNGKTEKDIFDLAPGIYSVTVTSGLGCSAVASVTVSGSQALTATVDVEHESCNGCNNGSATAKPSGNGNYTYLWSTGATTQTVSSLAPGTYTVTITNAEGCTAVLNAVINKFGCANTIAIAQNIVQPPCFGLNGTIFITPTGGKDPYTYLWNTGATGSSISVPAGTYSVVVTDAVGCQSGSNFELTQPEKLNAVIVDNGGTLTAFVSGGTPAYSYTWSTGEATVSIKPTSAGTYTVTVTDANGCTSQATFTTSAVDDILKTNVRLWPNPAGNILYLSIDQKETGMADIVIYNEAGLRALYRKVSFNGKDAVSIDISTLPAGAYFMRYNSARQTAGMRFIKI